MRRDIDFSSIFPVDRGFTLVEMIISIVITGIVVSMMAIFGRNQINAYMDVGNRAELSDAADTALRRIARDLQHPGLSTVVAAHLSRQNNQPALARAALATALDCSESDIGVADQALGTEWLPV